MSQVVFMPGFDGDAALRRDFVGEMSRRHEVRAVSYPNHPLGSLDEYRVRAMGEAPVDWEPALVAESFSGLVATRWAAVDPRIRAVVLCGAFASNPLGLATRLGASLPGLVKLGPAVFDNAVRLSGDRRRRRWSSELTRTMANLRDEVVAERLRLIADEDTSSMLSALRVPVVIVHFTGDMVISDAAHAHLVAACREPHVVRLEGPHFGLETRPRECALAIDAALRSVVPSWS
ncbi:MAG TPA: alpha/beta fold hydrolase [Usitatibacter sp.]|nr:alpha/beta fold hydrolase [Usitatibacter sp.]